MLERLSHDLAEQIGPLASVLVRRAAARATGLQDLQQMLAKTLPDADLRGAFLSASAARAGAGPTAASAGAGPAAPEASSQVLALPDAVYETLRHRLAENQGPFAKVLIKRALKQASDYPELCRAVAENLPYDQREGFIAFAAKLWDGVGTGSP